MAVLIELTSIVAPAAALGRFAPGADGAAEALGAAAVASDGQLVALAFRSIPEAVRALRRLEAAGLAFERGEEPGDLALVDQRRGPALWWPWLELARLGVPGGAVLAARHRGDARREPTAPAGWSFAGSASERLGVATLRLPDRPLRHLRREPDADVYLDPFAGEEVRLGRAHAPVRVVVEGASGPRGEVTAELVTARGEIEVGMMFRERVAPGEGMLFRFGAPGHHGFWMKNTLVPLDLLFVGDDGRVVNVVERAEPLTLAHRPSAGPVRQVLEVAGGWCAAHGAGPGDRVRVASEG